LGELKVFKAQQETNVGEWGGVSGLGETMSVQMKPRK